MIYAHLAKNVPSPSTKYEHIPQQLSAIVMKLVKKDPSDRYQLASAIRHDLQKILDKWSDSKARKGWTTASPDNIKEAFVEWQFNIGEKDYSQVISFPARPIGRKEQLHQLMFIFEEWYSTRSSERRGMFICLSGQRGTGRFCFWNFLCTLAIENNFFTCI
jgi:serine/threonine protein kinase